MSGLLCKLWMFVLKVVEAVVDGVGELVRTILTILLDVVTDLWDSTVGSGNVGGLLMIAGLGLLAFFFLGGRRDDGGTNVYT